MSKFVPDERIACVQPPGGSCVAMSEGAYLDYRAGLSEAERAALNVVYIPSKMGFARHRAVMDALIDVEARGGAMGLNFGAHQIALLRHNLLAWEGPDFAGFPLTPRALDALDPDDELIAFVLGEIARRNPRKASPDPKPAGAGG